MVSSVDSVSRVRNSCLVCSSQSFSRSGLGMGDRLQVTGDREQGKAASSQAPGNQPIVAKSSFIRSKQMIEMGLHRGPLGGDDAVDACVAQSAIGCELMAAQDSVQFCAQPFDGAPAGVVE